MIKLTREYVIEEFNARWGYRFDYSKFVYLGTYEESTIICSKHGEFLQAPKYHKTCKEPCPKCSDNNGTNTRKSNLQTFIIKANNIEKHKFKNYGYSKFIYNGNRIKGIIICPLHGEFLQDPDHHINREQGCPICGEDDIIKLGISSRLSQYKCIEDFKKLNGKLYDYSKYIYLGKEIKGIIICSKHGEFLQSYSGHYHQEQGCSKCYKSHGEKRVCLILESYNIKYEPQYTFKECINTLSKRKLKFDFFLEEYNALIEYDGTNHYSIEYLNNIGIRAPKYHTEEHYKKNKFNDNIKDKYCVDNNIPFLRIPFFTIIDNKTKGITKEEIEILIKNFINSLESDKL